jgi:hypothetical protein
VKMAAGAGLGRDASIQTGGQAKVAARTRCNQRASVRDAAQAPREQPLPLAQRVPRRKRTERKARRRQQLWQQRRTRTS